jgi:predicted RNase H-like HicB family nuclease
MEKNYSAVIKQEADWWIGWVEEIPGVNCQERTREELLETLKITLKEALEINKREALSAAGSDYSEVLLKV